MCSGGLTIRDGPSFQVYYLKIDDIVRSLLDKEKPGFLLTVDFDEYVDYLVQEIAWEPLIWHRDQVTIEPFTTRVEGYDQVFERSYTREEQRIRIRLPLSPHPNRADFIRYQPSTFWLNAEPEWRFQGDTLILEVEATENAVESGLEAVEFWLGNRNKDIEQGNRDLRQKIAVVVERRKRTLEEQGQKVREVLKNIDIPLHQDPNAAAKPVEIKARHVRTVIDKPTPRAPAPVASLKRDDVVGLVDFIEQYARQFEVTPVPYNRMSEEELRDSLIAMMNVNYPGAATGETFNKLGKTDINLRVDEGNVLICECKFWSGRKAYGEALDQLFRYLTWRQNYGVLIHFCKLKNMTKAIAEAHRATEEHASYVPGTLHEASETRFVSRHKHPQDAEKMVDVFHLFFDLSV
jgi:hypothetical protein